MRLYRLLSSLSLGIMLSCATQQINEEKSSVIRESLPPTYVKKIERCKADYLNNIRLDLRFKQEREECCEELSQKGLISDIDRCLENAYDHYDNDRARTNLDKKLCTQAAKNAYLSDSSENSK